MSTKAEAADTMASLQYWYTGSETYYAHTLTFTLCCTNMVVFKHNTHHISTLCFCHMYTLHSSIHTDTQRQDTSY